MLTVTLLWLAAKQFVPVGRLICEVTDPLAFEVHRAIDISPAPGTPSQAGPGLPTYVNRDHDRLLAAAVDRAAAGSSEMVVLVGQSSTGKTRACWEALARLPQGWRVWHPLRPDRPEAFLQDLPAVGPRTVVWLNEAQYYLQPTRERLGEHVAAELRELLRATDRGPVLVLGTLWPDYWNELTHRHEPPIESEEVHAQARDLLAFSTRIPVAATFDGQALAAARDQSRDDPRLMQALEHAEQGHITQYLAGGPALIDAYEDAPPAARALVHAAMDARRLGHGLALPLPLLEAAAPAYLTDPQWDSLKDNWLEQALAYVAQPVCGARGPLTRIRPRPGEPAPIPGQVAYRLADYLEQYGRSQRRTVRVPAGLWKAALASTDLSDRAALAAAAQNKGLLRLAFHLYTSIPPRHDNGDALGQAARLLQEAGRAEEAISWYQRAAEVGVTDALAWAARLLREAGRTEEAITWVQGRAKAGDIDALGLATWMLQEAGRAEEAITWVQSQVEAGHTDALRWAVQMLREAGRAEEAFNWVQSRAEAGDTDALELTAWMLQDAGRAEEAITWYQRAAEAGDTHALGQAARMLQEAGRAEEAITWYQRAAAAGQTDALRLTALMLQESGRAEEALSCYQRAAEASDPHALRLATQMLQDAGRADEALTWVQSQAVAGDPHALTRAAQMLRRTGRLKEAIIWTQERAEAGDTRALELAAQMLKESRRVDEASSLKRFGWDLDSKIAEPWTAAEEDLAFFL